MVTVQHRIETIEPKIQGKPVKWNPSQYEFITTEAEQAWLAGAWGCGKTYSLLWRGQRQAIRIPGGAGLIGTDCNPNFYRAIYPKLHDLWGDLIVYETKKPIHVIKTKTVDDSKPFTWYVQPYLEWEKLGGDDINVILGDEMTRCPRESHFALLPRLRHPASKKHYLSYASNNKGKNWTWEFFIKNNEDNERPNMWWKTTATHENLHNLPENYLNNFNCYPKKWWDRYILGQFIEFEGSVYDMLSSSAHLIKPLGKIPEYFQIMHTIDHGFDHPTVCVLWAIDPHGNLIAFKEYYRRGADPVDNAKAMAIMLHPFSKYGRGLFGYADPSMWARHGGRDCMAPYIKIFQAAGVAPPLPAFKRVGPKADLKTQIAYKVIAMLKPQDGHQHPLTGKAPAPSLYFTTDCPRTYDSVASVQWDEKAPPGIERVKKAEGDDGADVTGYACWNMPFASKKPTEPRIVRASLGREKNQPYVRHNFPQPGYPGMEKNRVPGIGAHQLYGVQGATRL